MHERVTSSRRVMRQMVGVVAHVAGVSPELLFGMARDWQTVDLRWIAIRLGRERGVSYHSMAVVLDKDHTTVQHAVAALLKALARGDWRAEYLIEIERRARAALAATPDQDWLEVKPAKDAPHWTNHRYHERNRPRKKPPALITATRAGYIRNGVIIVRP